jgi:hypothetical protein
VQAELLRLFQLRLQKIHLLELKKVMTKFLLEKEQEKADSIWDEKGYTGEKLQQMPDK